MSEKINANSLLMNAMYGINNTYNQLAAQNGGSLSFNDLSDTSKLSGLNYSNIPFLSYLQNNFSTLDQDQDGSISANDMQQLMNEFQMNGLTYSQLMQLCSSGTTGVDTTELSKVLADFQKIDRNSDGKVSMAEINAYNTTEEIDEKKEELISRRCSDMSVFYGDDSSSTKVDDEDDEKVKS